QLRDVPWVRVSAGVGWTGWARYVADELHDATRSSPAVRARAPALGAGAGGAAAERAAALGGGGRGVAEPAARAAPLCSGVTDEVEAPDAFADPAALALARRRGSRLPLA